MITLSVFFHGVQSFLADHAVLSPIAFIFSHILFAVFLVPCSPMAVIAGALWGKWLGLGISLLAAFLSSCTTFWVSRRFLREKMYRFLVKRYPKTDWFLEKTKIHGWKFVATVQLNPAMPGSTLGYLFGLTRIEFWVYAGFLFVFMLPLQILLVLCGDSFSKISSGAFPWIFVGLPLVVLGAYVVYGLFFKKDTVVNTR